MGGVGGGGGGGSWIRGSLLGAGSFGQVNLGMNRVTGSFFAVKSVVVDVMGSQNSVAALENEIQILQGLESEFVVRCLGSDWSEEAGQKMRNVFLEYMPGGSLSDLVKQFQSLDEQLIRSYTRSILQGIDYLHSRGIVHCDIKGKNVLVGNAGSVKLADFGSAKRVVVVDDDDDDEVVELREGNVQDCDAAVRKVNGTPLWMAPEVVLQKEQGLPSDIWSLGCTVVEMATGRAPWAQIADPFVALYRIGCTNEMPAVPDSLSPDAHDFLARCFERNPRLRWTSSQLLEHPFLTGGGAPRACEDLSPPGMQFPNTPVSPTSVLDHGSSSSSDVLSSSIPPLSSPRFWKLAALQFPKARVHSDEAGEGTGSSSSKNSKDLWWGTSSPLSPPGEGEWIVVRSPKAGNSSRPHTKFVGSPPKEELEVAISSEVIFRSSSAVLDADEVMTECPHIHEPCKSPRVAPVMMDSISTASTPTSSSSCFIASSSSISYIPRAARDDCAVAAEKLSVEASSSISKFRTLGLDILLKNLYPNLVQIKEPEAVVVTNFLHSLAVKDPLQQSQRFDHTTDCSRIFFWSLVEIQRACFKYFRANGVLMGVTHKHLSRRFLVSLEKYLQWFSLCNHMRPFQGFLGVDYCIKSWILSKQPIAIHLKIFVVCLSCAFVFVTNLNSTTFNSTTCNSTTFNSTT
jgi:serine/threonine protein kinase